MPIKQHGLASKVNYKKIIKRADEIEKNRMAFYVELFLIWIAEFKRLDGQETIYGKTGFTIGKFCDEWFKACDHEDQQATAKTACEYVRKINTIDPYVKLNTVLNTTMLMKEYCRVTAKGKAKVVPPTVKSIRFSSQRKDEIAAILRRGKLSDAEIASLLAFGALGK